MILKVNWDRTVEGFRKSNSSAEFCEVVTGGQGRVEVFKAKGTDLEIGNLLLCLCGMIFKTSVCSDIYSPM